MAFGEQKAQPGGPSMRSGQEMGPRRCLLNSLIHCSGEASQHGMEGNIHVPLQMHPLTCSVLLSAYETDCSAPSSSGFLSSLSNRNPGGRLEGGKGKKSGCAELAGSPSDAVPSLRLSFLV